MRHPKYLSPTSLAVWAENQEEYYLRYLAEHRPPRFPQTQPMSVGSSFDAYIKSDLHSKLFGGKDLRFEFDTIFQNQVEEHNRDWALDAGKHAFESYKTSGAMYDLFKQLEEAKSEPRFEFTIQEEIKGVPILGKPDVYFTHKAGQNIILDFKVNGYCSKHPVSPKRGYIRVRDGWDNYPPSRIVDVQHKDAFPMLHEGVIINISEHFETIDEQWSTQLATYGWLCGDEVGSEFIVAIDQLACKPHIENKPLIRVAEHRGLLGKEFQLETMSRYSELWEIIHSNHIFREMSFVDSSARCEMLDIQYKAYEIEGGFTKQEAQMWKELMGRE